MEIKIIPKKSLIYTHPGSTDDINILYPVQTKDLTPYAIERIKITNDVIDKLNDMPPSVDPRIVNLEEISKQPPHKYALPPIKTKDLPPAAIEQLKMISDRNKTP